jgi:hypothetical protein
MSGQYPVRSAAIASFVAASLGLACAGGQCDRDGQTPQTFRDGHTNAARTFYESSSSEGPFLFFPSGRTYRFVHGLSEQPAVFGAFLAFSESPLEDGSGFAHAAGNEVIYERIGDDFVEIRNDTCAELFVRLWASVAPFEAVNIDSDAGAGSGAGLTRADAGR